MQRLRERREAMGWSQRQLAEKAMCSQQAVASYEKGERMPSGDVLVRLARFLGVSSAYLLGLSDSPERDDRLPENWVAVVEEAMSQGFSPDDVRRAIRGLRVMLGQEPDSRQNDG